MFKKFGYWQWKFNFAMVKDLQEISNTLEKPSPSSFWKKALLNHPSNKHESILFFWTSAFFKEEKKGKTKKLEIFFQDAIGNFNKNDLGFLLHALIWSSS